MSEITDFAVGDKLYEFIKKISKFDKRSLFAKLSFAMKVLITGGTGLIGEYLGKKLQIKGYEVAILSRKKNTDTAFQAYRWDPYGNSMENEAIETSDYIVHLAGANLADKRWTDERKKEIIDSRVKTAGLLFETAKKTGKKLKAFISASGSSYYGMVTSDKIFNEDDPPGNDFMGETCIKWEHSANRFRQLGARVVVLRQGAVFSTRGGALPKMNLPVRLGVAAPVGSGKQYMPWIHIDDICRIYIRAIEDDQMEGPYNAASPEHATNKDIMKTLARVQDKPFWAPNAPSAAMKLAFGEMAQVLLKGSRISAEKLISAGYEFRFPELEGALANLMKKSGD